MLNLVCPTRYGVNKKSIREGVSQMYAVKHINSKLTLNIVFIGTRKMREIAKTYKHEDLPLPVLAFPYKDVDTEGEQLLGEIFLCYPMVVLLAAERSKMVDDMILRLVEHGLDNIIQDQSTPLKK